uniref:Ubiquitin-like protease family profile domain-containing protein n=1 Tax=Glossina palpalis gambiensis TaxID=67801 RepID=A0A1B0BCJ0_9MUSC
MSNKNSRVAPTLLSPIPEESGSIRQEYFSKIVLISGETIDYLVGKRERFYVKHKDYLSLTDTTPDSENKWLSDEIISYILSYVLPKSEKVGYFAANIAHNYITHDIPFSLELSMKNTMIMAVHVNGDHWCVAIINQITKLTEFYDPF